LYLACSSESKSEIVVPLSDCDNVFGVLDVDSEHLNNFDEIDNIYLNEICKLLIKKF
jgi:GAF domain-containing protein